MFRVYPNSGGVPSDIVLYDYKYGYNKIVWGYGSFYAGPEWTETATIYQDQSSDDTVATDYITKSAPQVSKISGNHQTVKYNTVKIKALYDMKVKIYAKIHYSSTKTGKVIGGGIGIKYYYKINSNDPVEMINISDDDIIGNNGTSTPKEETVTINLKQNDTIMFFAQTPDARAAHHDPDDPDPQGLSYHRGRNLKFSNLTITTV